MKNAYYPAVFHPEEVGYSVFIPDIEGCSTQGDTIDEAVEMAKDAIGLMLEGISEYPQATTPSNLSPEGEDFVVMIPFNAAEYARKNNRSVKKTLSLPAWLNEAAEAAHLNFSGVLQEALKAKLGMEGQNQG